MKRNSIQILRSGCVLLAWILITAAARGALIDVGRNYLVPEIPQASDFTNTIYVDPSSPTNGVGTQSNPRNSLNSPALVSDTAYLILAGTVLQETIDSPPSDVYFGRYGTGPNPILRYTGFANVNIADGSDNITFDRVDLEKFGVTSPGNDTNVNFAKVTQISNIHFSNCRIQGYNSGQGYPDFNFRGACNYLTVFECEVSYCQEDAFFIASCHDVRIVSTYIHHANQSLGGGDGIQFEYEDYSNSYIANNWIDRSDTPHKFCFIVNAPSTTSGIVMEWNTMFGPEDSPDKGATVQWFPGQNDIFRKNLMYSVSGISGFNTTANYCSEPAPYGIRDNHYIGPNPFWNFTSWTSTNVLHYTTEQAYLSALNAGTIPRYGSDIFDAPDTEPPSTPTNLGGTTGPNAAYLTWTASTDNEAVIGYIIYRNSVQVGTASATSYEDTGLQSATGYTYRVSAFDAAGNQSAQSASVYLTTGAQDTIDPSIPTNLTVTGSTPTTIGLGWTASTDNVGVLGYNVYSSGTYVGSSASTSFTAVGLTNDYPYGFVVSAFDAAGNESDPSGEVIGTTQSLPDFLGKNNFGTARHELGDYNDLVPITTTFDLIPYQNYIDGVVAYSDSSTVAGTFGSLSAILRLNPSGYFDARDGGVYTAEATLNYAANTTYHVRFEIDLSQASYDVFVAPAGQSEVQIAQDYAFRTGAPAMDDLGAVYGYCVTGNDLFGVQGHAIDLGLTTDTQAPTIPAGLAVGSVTVSSVDLTWSASTDNVAVAGYEVFRDGFSIGTTSATGLTDTGLSAQTSYLYTVRAYDAAGNYSGLSSSVLATTATPPDTQAPTTPGGLSASTVTTSTLNLSWNASTDNVGVTGYEVYRNGGLLGTTSTNAFSDSGLSPSTSYTYTVTAFDAAGNTSAASSGLQVTTQTPPDTQAPTTPTGLAAGAVTTTSVGLSWNASTDNVGVTGYRVYRDSALVGTTTTTSYADSGLSATTTYTYAVSAYDAAGNVSSQSSAVQVTTAGGSSLTFADLGAVGVSGSYGMTGGVYTISASGADIWNAADAFGFAYTTLTGDGEIIARVVSLQNTHAWAKAGVMIRKSLNANSAHALIAFNPNGYSGFIRRTSDGATSSATNVYGATTPWWVRLVRSGNTFTSFVSSNGQNWTQVGSTSITMGGTVYMGLAVCSHDNATTTQAVFDNVSYTGGGGDVQAPTVPAGLTETSTTASSASFSWSASSDNVGVAGYRVFRDGVEITTTTATNYADTGLSADTTYSYAVSAFDAAGNESALSSALAVTTDAELVPLPDLYSKSNFSAATHSLGTSNTGSVTATFDITPLYANIDGLVAYVDTSTSPTWYDQLAAIVRLNTSGQFDARNGGSYAATNTLGYSANVVYHVRIEFNLGASTYDVYVTPNGGSEVMIANGFAFRTGAPGMNDVGKLIALSVGADDRYLLENHLVSAP